MGSSQQSSGPDFTSFGKIPVQRVCKNVLNAHKEDEKKKLNDCMEFYLQICSQAMVRAEPLIVEKEDVCRGIVQVVSELGITKLIMGKRSKKSNMQVTGKAGYVIRHAINSCEISIICKGKLIAAREGSVLDNGRSMAFQSNFQRHLAASIETRAHFPVQSRLETTPSSINLEFHEYPLEDIKATTGNFCNHSKLGGGGSGTVYKGKIGHATVTVKIVGEDSFQGRQEFQREIDILRDIRHPNLVKVIGACFEDGCILYEYMTNGSLADRLSCKDSTPSLPWYARIRIATDVCSGLQFLHSLDPDPIVHHDLKPENILLDQNYVGKISDFGLSRRLHRDVHKESEPKGTFPYMDPEYLRSGEYSTKSDVYSLGIIFLQLLTGNQ
ncbi:U-box domain-containing protein 52-like [Cryptomeria japonica]|uniref:U-box domain-containing protein 52-like n=1 Tax=Cryptomeria japonica TaxID=3369 RepID=UPI0027DA80FD|nr:U-box domain-containing protein 52-like [Cryptomeria japonica]